MPFLPKDVEVQDNQPGFNFPEFSNAAGDPVDVGGIAGGIGGLLGTIISHATGTAQQSAQAQQLQAQAQIEMARAEQLKATRKSQAVTVAVVLVIGAAVITTGIFAFKAYKRKRGS